MVRDRCLVPNPDNPIDTCLHFSGRGHDGKHTWWYCASEFGDWPSLSCELKRGHDGDHEGHWA